MLKHVGQHSQKKVVLLYRQVPNEDHMCLVIYSDSLPRAIHDEVMKCLESDVGQQANDFADALFRVTMSDGRNALTTLHHEGFIKKLPTNQVIVTPTPTSKVRLDELNNILTEMAKGADAVKRLADLDSQSGIRDPAKARANNKAKKEATSEPARQAVTDEVLTDEVLAQQRINQAKKMRADATTLLAEADRLEAEATTLVKVTTKAPRKNARTAKETTAKKAKVKTS